MRAVDWWGIKEAILDIIYPIGIRCLICGGRKTDLMPSGECRECRDSLPFIAPPICPKCGKPVLVQGEVCPDCEHVYHPYRQAMSILEYRRAVPELVHRFKYQGERILSKPMIEWMSNGVKMNGWDFDIIVPVPLHLRREKKRGFNQAALLAEGIGRNLGKQVLRHNLIRVIDTHTQANLDKSARMANLQGAFKILVPSQFKDRDVLLVDDVYTTGATVDECSRVILGAGARNVFVLTLATGRNT